MLANLLPFGEQCCAITIGGRGRVTNRDIDEAPTQSSVLFLRRRTVGLEPTAFARSPQILFLITGKGAIGQFLATDPWSLLPTRTAADQCAQIFFPVASVSARCPKHRNFAGIAPPS